jgi:hypothetical protein
MQRQRRVRSGARSSHAIGCGVPITPLALVTEIRVEPEKAFEFSSEAAPFLQREHP